MAINFPSAPNSGDSYTDGSQTWIYNGSAWDAFYQPTAKSQVGLGNVDNTSDINKPVSTAQQAAIDAAGGSSFDQDLNTTDSPTFATLTTTNTIATDVYAVDVGATGTVTAGEVTTNQINSTGSFISFQPTNFERLQITSTDIRPNSFGDYDLGRSTNTFNDCHLHGTLSTTNIDATGTVTAGDVTADSAVFNLPSVGSSYVLEVQSGGARNFSVDGYGNVESKTIIPRIDGSFDFGSTSRRWRDLFTNDIDATGTVTAGGFVGTPQTLTDAASITYDLANGHNAKVTLTDDRILLFPTNIAEGASGVLTVTQDGTGGRALTFGSGWFISAGAAADISALGAGEKAQVTWYAHSSSDVNATILPLQ